MRQIFAAGLLIAMSFSCSSYSASQAAPTLAPASSFPSDYPADQPGIFLHSLSWKEITNETPTKTKAKHGIAASLSYGAVPAKIVAEYEGEHAPTQAQPGELVICICHLISLPGEPVIVRLHAKKNVRELDGGKMIVYPVVGGSKSTDANKSDLIPVEVAHSDPHVWLVRPKTPLAAGDYALMLGTQNVNIYPFTVVESSDSHGQSSAN